MSKEAENIISLIDNGILPPINQNETFGINMSTFSPSNESKIKKQAYKEFAERLKSYLLLNKKGEMSVISFENINDLLKEMVGEEE